MSAIQISRAARLQIRELLAAQFNALLGAACSEFDIAEQAFDIDYEIPGTTFFYAPYTFSDLQDRIGKLGEVQTLSTRLATDEHQQFACVFNGPVSVQIETFLKWPCVDTTSVPDTESLCDAVEAALAAILNTDTVQSRPGSVSFERTELQLINDIWYRSVVCTAELEVTV